ncbi:Fe(3+)-hydroxamate ABC transporter permease FhuB [Hansschlegelia sp.]|uniref:Fe(3+)-hydroxamate ABC transporter permease FhuB n=1 Tax=Hansschlegelia sp. TaxID=2041892 RepID=UPI002B92608C|nr:Fe(3+)-hydroxamate ABC transporter permease FhuB [Hansschlegelia sp.]HVI27874.1 Fe(3+)-hydroxamate ABC transporter permease FhuB [Hansschlegelia sp.]
MADRLRAKRVVALPAVAAALAAAALGLTALTARATLGPDLSWSSFADPGSDIHALVLREMAAPRVVVSLLVGAALGLSGALLQHALRNPLADATTLGVSSGAYLALAAASLFAPDLLDRGQEAAALAGGGAATLSVVALTRRHGFAPTAVILVGLTLNLLLGGVGAALTIFHHDTLTTLFVWQTGSLVQNGWSSVEYLAPRLALCGAAAALLARPLSVLALDDRQSSAVGLPVGVMRGLAVAIAAALAAFSVSAAGVIGFVGLAAPQIARLLGARKLRQRLSWATTFGALLLWLTDQCVQRVAFFHAELPTGSATALFGAPMLLLALRSRPAGREPLRPGAPQPRAQRPFLALAMFGVLLVGAAAAATAFGRSASGWAWLSGADFQLVAPWRAPRVAVAGAAGSMLAMAGLLLHRLTGNPMASPESLGVSSGAALGVVLLLLAAPDFSQIAMTAAAGGGAAAALALVAPTARSSGSPDRLLLTGMALSMMFSAFAATLLTSGDPRAAILLSWMSGSTYRVSASAAQLALGVAAAGLAASLLVWRWLEISPLGGTTVRAVGVPMTLARTVILGLAAILTAAATLLVGPLSFVGLMAPHLTRELGLRRPLEQTLGSAALGGTLMMLADWVGRNMFFPWQAPAGLMAALLGAPVYLWLAGGRRA